MLFTLNIDQNGFEYISVRIVEISIEFQCHQQICEIDNEFKSFELYLETNKLVYPCTNDENDHIKTNDTCALLKSDINKPKDKVDRSNTKIYITLATIISLFLIMSIYYLIRRRANTIEVSDDHENIVNEFANICHFVYFWCLIFSFIQILNPEHRQIKEH
ncbi:hypothetical protein RF11_13012 [Thelohanellus kitauei]|uniref:Uncharacterized protein n=1 Tax=Thelohanellus kitauei TaxID=669202 RepID=A0A0C2MIW1_THEKT|nr:hypothetical protein RF11_13012 [Thelohanellus kitauei]